MSSEFAKQLVHYIDLTRLEENDVPENIDALCKKAVTPFGNVAAVCVYPAFVRRAKLLLEKTGIRVATVANFPTADYSIGETINVINNAIQSGADEVDVVMPRNANAADYLAQCREVCGEKIMKVILETGALVNDQAVLDASIIAIKCGADFLKTSTGKIKVGATLSAASVMLEAIKQFPDKTVGLKISGGVRDEKTAREYWDLVIDKMGVNWIRPRTFRIGASSLLDELLRA